MLRKIAALAILAGLGMVAAVAQARGEDTLDVGNSAPPLRVAKWVQGDAVEGFDKGKIYVVEFWATWCGPCKDSIPHINKLSKEHKDVTFVGVSILENDFAAVPKFVKQMGDKMTYRVATDFVKEGGDAGNGFMAVNWMNAAGLEGIPAAFIVNGDSKVAWIGHPMDMDKPLEQIVNGKWDLQAAAEEAKKSREMQAMRDKLNVALGKAVRDKDVKQILELIDQVDKAQSGAGLVVGMQVAQIFASQANEPKLALELIDAIEKKYPKAAGATLRMRFLANVQLKNGKEASAAGSKLIDAIKGNPNEGVLLNEIAWSLVDPDQPKLADRDLDLALKAAERAVELTNESPEVLDTLGVVLFERGDLEKAVEVQKKAVSKGRDAGIDVEELEQRLEQFEKALKGKKGDKDKDSDKDKN